ncbi:MAG: methionyl-tRNA formyltransferase [Tannerella sp.]|jgi:methionyl-tRNA formyltransferase|nr:methionyl-tRNA formyltransferase [Tannerella sp.]
MTKDDLKIVFMGTPDFAVASLRALVEGGYHVAGVVTMPDKPMGRHGSMPQISAVKRYAVSAGLPTLQPERLKDESFLCDLRAMHADLQIVAAFRMLPEVVWSMPRFGTFNLHASLLPQYRGAAPVNWVIINGEKETGVTTFFLTHEIDAGRIIRQKRLPVAKTDDAGTVHDALMALGAQLVVETTDLLIENDGNIASIPQEALCADVRELHPAPKIFNDTCRINWNQTVEHIYDFIRGLSPYPAAWTELISPEGKRLTAKIFRSEKRIENCRLTPGSIHTDGKHIMDIAVDDGFIRILSIQLSGKKRMSINDCLNGIKIDNAWQVE